MDFAVILATVVAGFLGTPWWAAAVAFSALLAIALSGIREYRQRTLTAGGSEAWTHARLSAVSSAFTAAAAAYICGRLIGWGSSLLESYLRSVL